MLHHMTAWRRIKRCLSSRGTNERLVNENKTILWDFFFSHFGNCDSTIFCCINKFILFKCFKVIYDC